MAHGEFCKGTFGVVCLSCNERVDVAELTGPSAERMEVLEKLIVKLDSHLSAARHRYVGHLWPVDLIREVDETISEARRLTRK